MIEQARSDPGGRSDFRRDSLPETRSHTRWVCLLLGKDCRQPDGEPRNHYYRLRRDYLQQMVEVHSLQVHAKEAVRRSAVLLVRALSAGFAGLTGHNAGWQALAALLDKCTVYALTVESCIHVCMYRGRLWQHLDDAR